jgi:hypothetical protein
MKHEEFLRIKIRHVRYKFIVPCALEFEACACAWVCFEENVERPPAGAAIPIAGS